jgi:predicted P-loop ATPase
MLRVMVEREYRFDPGSQNTHDAAVQECLQESYDPVQDYLDDLIWDRRERIDRWMVDYLGAEDGALVRAVSRLCLVAAVRRARRPGTKFDQIIVLEGPEGRGKSSAIEILAGTENFSDQTLLGIDDRGHQEALAGVWLYEIADLAGHSRTEIERMKAFASRTHDRARPAYGRCRVDVPRRCIFFGSTNNDTYLKSQTGNRRFWPVRCGRIDLVGLKRDRDQLWAEASAIEASGASLVLPESLWGTAAAMQDMRRDHDPWDDALAGLERHGCVKAEGGELRVSSRDVLSLVLGIGADKQNDVTAKRAAFSLRRLGWQGPKVVRFGDVLAKGYVKT